MKQEAGTKKFKKKRFRPRTAVGRCMYNRILEKVHPVLGMLDALIEDSSVTEAVAYELIGIIEGMPPRSELEEIFSEMGLICWKLERKYLLTMDQRKLFNAFLSDNGVKALEPRSYDALHNYLLPRLLESYNKLCDKALSTVEESNDINDLKNALQFYQKEMEAATAVHTALAGAIIGEDL